MDSTTLDYSNRPSNLWLLINWKAEKTDLQAAILYLASCHMLIETIHIVK